MTEYLGVLLYFAIATGLGIVIIFACFPYQQLCGELKAEVFALSSQVHGATSSTPAVQLTGANVNQLQ